MKKNSNIGITLIEVLVALSIASFIFILVIDLFLQLLKTERRLSQFNQMSTTTNKIFDQINNDVRWAQNSPNNISIENNPLTNTMKLSINNPTGTPIIVYQYDASSKQIRMTRDGVDTNLLPDNLQVAELLFQDMRVSSDYQPLIYTRLSLRSITNQDTILFERQTIASNLNTSLDINAVLPLTTQTPTPTPGTGTPTSTPTTALLATNTPTSTPVANATNTPTPTATPTPPPGCELENIPGSWSSVTVGGGQPGKVNLNNNLMTICGDSKGINANQSSEGFHAALRSSSANNLEIATKLSQWHPNNSNSQAGLIIRSSTASNSAFASLTIDGNNKLTISSRDRDGDRSDQLIQWGVSPTNTWLKLIKSTNTITAYISSNSTDGFNGNWQQVHTLPDMTLGVNYMYGRLVTSSNTSAFASAVFSQMVVSENLITISPPPTPTPKPATPTPTGPTATPKPTNTPANTPTPKATNTPQPTSTPTNVPTVYIPD